MKTFINKVRAEISLQHFANANGNTIYDNFFLEAKVKDMMNTKLEMSQFYTSDYSLTEAAGMIKKIHVYSATGDVRDVGLTEGNQSADDVHVSFTEEQYTVKYTQGRMEYYDEEAMTDPMLVQVGLEKMSANMVNNLTSKFFVELGKADLTVEYPVTGISFDDVVDALAKFPENEEGLYMLINPTQKAKLRKNLKTELKYVEDFVRTGYIGTVCGVPIFESKAVPDKTAFIASKSAVTVFVKKGVETEQERNANLRKNSIFSRRCNIVALTDKTRALKLTEALA